MDTAISDWNTPVYSAIKAYTNSRPVPFHMPGHKLGRGIPDAFLSEIEKLDLTEIPGTDNLHAPTGALREAQRLTAEAFGAKESFFLVNGSTVGLQTAISAVCRHGQRLIVGRDSHRAVIHGMLLSGVQPCYLMPEYSEAFEIHTGYSVKAIENALLDAPDAVGVLITRPNYYGVCSDIREIAKTVHLHNKLLIVDEAHGPHLAFNPRLPESALEAGADLCIQSAHKTLPAFTQGAYLHIGSDRIDRDRIRYFLDLYQTTSPSYIIMAYLDIAREIMQKCGKSMLDGLLDSIEVCAGEYVSRGDNHSKICHWKRRYMETSDGGTGYREIREGEICDGEIRLLGQIDVPGFDYDRTRITANVSGLGMTGYAVEKILMEKYKIQVEMSDLKNIVCIATVADDQQSIEHLFSALSALRRLTGSGNRELCNLRASAAGCDTLTGECAMNLPDFRRLTLPERMMEPQEILDAQVDRIPLDQAEGRICRGIISPYPPGIALICPGESIHRETVAYLREIIQAGGVAQGIGEDGTVEVIR